MANKTPTVGCLTTAPDSQSPYCLPLDPTAVLRAAANFFARAARALASAVPHVASTSGSVIGFRCWRPAPRSAPRVATPAGDQVAAALVTRAQAGLDEQDAPGQIPVLARYSRLDRHASSVQAFGAVRTIYQPLQRCFRDLHAADQHILFSASRDKAYAKLRLGIEQSTFLV